MARKANPAFEEMDAFTKEWDSISSKLVPEIRKQLSKNLSIGAAVNAAYKNLKISPQIRDAILEEVLEAVKKGGIQFTSELSVRKFFLDKTWPGDKLKLSQRIAKTETKAIIRETIDLQLKNNKTFTQIAKSVTDKQLIKADISKTFTQLDRQARRVAQGDVTAIRKYKSTLNKAQRQVNNLAKAGAPTQRLKKAYQNVIRATEKMNLQQMDRAIDRAVRAKARFNAERIARTEISRAYGVGRQTEANLDPDVVGIRWVLSTRHVETDICDFHADADLYEMGPGGYPKDEVPAYPAHPNCMCLLEDIFVDEADPGKFNKDAGERFIKRQPAATQKKLLGVGGRERFLKRPNAWRSELTSYQGPVKVPTLPKRLVEE